MRVITFMIAHMLENGNYANKVIAAYFTNKNHRRPWEELRMESP